MRWKLLVGNLVAVILVGVMGWWLTRSEAAAVLVRDVDPSVDRGVELLSAVRDQAGDALLDAVEDAATSPELAAVFAAESESARREAAFTFAERQARAFASLPRRGRQADLVAVLDETGKVIARNVERNQDVGRDLRAEFPAVARALTGARGAKVRDYVRYGDQSWLEVSVVSVAGEGHPRGALLVGFAPADSAARDDANRVGVGVGYVFREANRFTVQSLSVGQQTEKEQLGTWLNAQGAELFRGRARYTVTLGGQEYRAAVLPMPGASGGQIGGAVVLRSLTAAKDPSSDVAMPSLLAMLLGILIVTAYNLYLALYLQKPIEQIEDGLLQVINGNPHHRIQVEHEELGGVIYRVNQLLASVDDEDQGEGGGS